MKTVWLVLLMYLGLASMLLAGCDDDTEDMATTDDPEA